MLIEKQPTPLVNNLYHVLQQTVLVRVHTSPIMIHLAKAEATNPEQKIVQ